MTNNDLHPVVQISRASIEKRDLNVLVRTIQPLRPKVVLEVGCWKGYSSEVWSESFHPELLITLDKDNQFEDTHMVGNDNFHYLFGTDSTTDETRDKVKNLLGDREVEFLFIDGDHNYNAVRRDFELYAPLVAKGGIIAFHDICYTQHNCQVPLLWQQLKRMYPYVESNVGEGSTGLGFIYNQPNTLSVAQKSNIL